MSIFMGSVQVKADAFKEECESYQFVLVVTTSLTVSTVLSLAITSKVNVALYVPLPFKAKT